MPRDGLPDDNLSVRGSRLRLGLYALALAGGSAAVAAVTAAGALLAGTRGQPWPVEAGAVLAGLGLGVWLGGRLSGPLATLRMTLRRLAACFGAAAVASVAAALLPSAVAALAADLALAPLAAAALAGGALLAPPALAAGAALAVLLKLAVDERPLERGPALGAMLACCAAGGLAGMVLTEAVTLARFGGAGTMTGAGVMFASLALMFALAEPRAMSDRR